jgi:hypothetical protein
MKAKWTHLLMVSALALPLGVYAQDRANNGSANNGNDTRQSDRDQAQGKTPLDRPQSSSSTGASTTATERSGASNANRSASTTAADAAITAKVKTQLIKDKDVSAMNVNVDTANGVVTLKGNAKSRAEADKAASLARSVEGVKSVKNDLVVGAADMNRSSGASTGASPRSDNKSTGAASSVKSGTKDSQPVKDAQPKSGDPREGNRQ